MKEFLSEYFNYLDKYLNINYPSILVNFIDIDKEKMFKYEEKESPLHNSVNYLNKNLLNNISPNSKLLEIGCGTQSIFLEKRITRIIRQDGLDIHEKDFKGKATLANIIGTVANIPTRSNFYDYCISNQSIEHWFEYGVSLSLGLSEINRVLKDNGRMIINFPLFLHGKSEFVKGNIEYIIKEISNHFLIKEITLIHSSKRKYQGWKNCRQDIYRIKSFISKKGITSIPESFVCEIVGEKIFYKNQEKVLETSRISKTLRRINLYKDYTFYELFIKVINKIFKKKK